MASRVRKELGLSPLDALCVFDVAERLGVEVRFVDIGSSLEGLYFCDPSPTILVTALRPSGRRAFTCAHELGHHLFGHGTRMDVFLDDTGLAANADEERMADLFAAHLLMPKLSILRGFRERGWDPSSPTAEQVYIIAGWLGVGFETLVSHMRLSLGLLDVTQWNHLSREVPARIRSGLLGEPSMGDVLVVDSNWTGRAADLAVGDIIQCVPGVVVDGQSLHQRGAQPDRLLLDAVAPGRSHIHGPDGAWAVFVRVSRRGFVGRAIFRHEEEVPDEV